MDIILLMELKIAHVVHCIQMLVYFVYKITIKLNFCNTVWLFSKYLNSLDNRIENNKILPMGIIYLFFKQQISRLFLVCL